MSKPFSILHISDLHRSILDPISNDELISALIGDRDRYTRESPKVAPPEAIVVSGDIIQGVGLGETEYERKLAEQYGVAEAFLDELVRRLLDGDRSRVVMVPGNHDIDWNTALAAMEQVNGPNMPSDVHGAITRENTEYRWDWRNLILYRIRDQARYERRLEAFWHFFERFYAGVPGLLKVQARSDANLFRLCDGRIGVAAYNSCHGNDCFAYQGTIRKEVIARSHLELNDSGEIFDLRISVWHHSIEGPPQRTDYMDAEIVRGMIGRGFRLGLYGHQHKAQVAPHQVWLPDQERMAVVSAGSLCAGAKELPGGTFRQYNVVEIAPDFRSVRVHVRSMSVANLFSRGQLPDFGGESFAELDWKPPHNAVGGAIDTDAIRRRTAIEHAEFAAKSGNPERAVEILRPLDRPMGSYERQLFLVAAVEAERWGTVVEATDPPSTIEELIQRVEACNRMKDFETALESLDKYSRQLQLNHAIESELRQRIAALEATQE